MVSNNTRNVRRKRDTNGLVAGVLAVLVTIIIVLAVIIIVNLVKNNSGQESVPSSEATPEDIEKTDVIETIRQRVADVDSWEEYINGKINEYKDTDYEVEIITIKVNRLLFEGRVADALDILNNMNPNEMSEYDKILYYLAMKNANTSAGDTAAVEKYTELFETTRNNYYKDFEGAGGG